MHLIPPMDDEPPPAYVTFVATHLAELRDETERLVGGDPEGSHLYMDVLADIAGHWRRLCWRSRLTGHDATGEYLRRRLINRTRNWREDQIYDVDIRVLPPSQPLFPVREMASLALLKAALLPSTERAVVGPAADAGIAWVHAYRRHQWHRVGRLVAASILLVGSMIQYVSWASATY